MNDLTRTNGAGIASGQAWRQELPFWLQYLIAAYPRAKNDAMTFAVYEDQFGGVGDRVMMAAVKRWVQANTFWPAVHELRSYVEWAEGETAEPAGDDNLESLRSRYRAYMARLRARIRHSDDEILAWEQKRGTLPAENAPVPPTDPDYLEQIRAAEERARQIQAEFEAKPAGRSVPASGGVHVQV